MKKEKKGSIHDLMRDGVTNTLQDGTDRQTGKYEKKKRQPRMGYVLRNGNSDIGEGGDRME